MHKVACLPFAAVLWSVGCAPPRALQGTSSPLQVGAEREVFGREVRDVALIVSDAWTERLTISPDGARADGRSLYLLLNRDPNYAASLGSDVRSALLADTAEYEAQPPRPIGTRLWSVYSVRQVSEERAELVARLTYGAAQHTEVYVLSRVPKGGARTWSISEVRIHQRTWY